MLWLHLAKAVRGLPYGVQEKKWRRNSDCLLGRLDVFLSIMYACCPEPGYDRVATWYSERIFFYHSDKTVLLYVIGTGSNGSLEFKTGNKPQQEANCRII